MQHPNRALSAQEQQGMASASDRAAEIIAKRVQTTLKGLHQEVSNRSYRAANELRTASLYVLRGQRSGRQYRIPHTQRMNQASSPGEAPANRTGMFRLSWRPMIRVEKKGKVFRAISAIESNLTVQGRRRWILGELLEGGTRYMAPRPYKDAVRERAAPQIKALYRKPYKT